MLLENCLLNAQSVVDYAVFDLIADALTTHGYCILPQLLPPHSVRICIAAWRVWKNIMT